jgi:ABC-type amino acid transport substrate-binding protein
MKHLTQCLLAALFAMLLTAGFGEPLIAQLTGKVYKFDSFSADEGLAEMQAAEQAKIDAINVDSALANSPRAMQTSRMPK